MDVVVWTESEERERWWREIVGIAPAGDRCGAMDVGESAQRNLVQVSRRCDEAPSPLQAVSAA